MSQKAVTDELEQKQDKLVAGKNIATLNHYALVGYTNVQIGLNNTNISSGTTTQDIDIPSSYGDPVISATFSSNSQASVAFPTLQLRIPAGYSGGDSVNVRVDDVTKGRWSQRSVILPKNSSSNELNFIGTVPVPLIIEPGSTVTMKVSSPIATGIKLRVGPSNTTMALVRTQTG